MSKPALRFLALGFLISAIVLSGYRLFLYEPQASAKKTIAVENAQPNKEELSYKKKYEELLAETEVANLTKENATGSKSDQKEDDTSSKPTITKATIIVNDGDPSSIAVQQLKNQGIIKDSTEFEKFLEGNNYISLIRPGTYEVSSEMDFQQLADTLMDR